jgi:hypothetical protein
MKQRRVRWAGNVARVGEMRNVYKILVRKSEGKRPLGRTRRRWKDNTRMYHTEIGWEVVDWIHLAESRDQWRVLVDTVMNVPVP